jgi:adenosine 3'-phospho 5'-phosphosulfate transporter B2
MAVGDTSTSNAAMDAENRHDASQVAAWCVFLSAGLIGTLLVYGVIQERIMQHSFDGVMFTVSAFLVLCNRVINFTFAAGMMTYNQEPKTNTAPLWKYLVISLSNVAASTCQYEALKYVSFPVQMLGKSFKMMPVMIWGILINSKQYSFAEWLVAAGVTGGVTEFLLTGPIQASSSDGSSGSSGYGLVLLLIFLVCDGLTSTVQEMLFKEYKTTKYNQMFYVNLASAVVSFVAVTSAGQMSHCIVFCTTHLDFTTSVLILSGAAASSQWFIYTTVQHFGALVFAAVMNVRQVASIIMSYVKYHHHITLLQSVGLCIVFSALFYKSYQGLKSSKKQKLDEATPIKPIAIAREDAKV